MLHVLTVFKIPLKPDRLKPQSINFSEGTLICRLIHSGFLKTCERCSRHCIATRHVDAEAAPTTVTHHPLR